MKQQKTSHSFFQKVSNTFQEFIQSFTHAYLKLKHRLNFIDLNGIGYLRLIKSNRIAGIHCTSKYSIQLFLA